MPTEQGVPGGAVTRSLLVQEALVAWCPEANSTVQDGTRSCFKGLLPAVRRQQHLSRPATAQLVELLGVDEPFLIGLAVAEESATLAPAQIEPTRQVLAWSVPIAVAAYRHRERTTAAARQAFTLRHGPMLTKEDRDRCRALWQSAVRVAALNLVADRVVPLTRLDELPRELQRLTVEQIWSALPDRRAVDEAERRAALDTVSRLLLSRPEPWLRLIAREGLGPTWADEVLARAARKLVDSRTLDADRATEQFVTTVVQSVVKDVRAELVRGPIPVDHTDEWVVATLGAATGPGDADPADLVADRLAFGAATARHHDPTGRTEISAVLARMVRTGPRQGVKPSVLDAHDYARGRLEATRSVLPRDGLPRWYERYYLRSVGSPPAIAVDRARDRMRELRHAVAHGCFPPPWAQA